MTEDSQLSISFRNDWLELALDSLRCIAGERLSGEVLVQLPNNSQNLSISLRSKGEESVRIETVSGKIIEHVATVFTFNSVLTDSISTGKIQAIFPFTFKIPLYSPSSFHFSDRDTEGNIITISVEYEIEANIYSQTSDLDKVKKKFHVFNRSTRKVLSGSIKSDTALTCCLCCNRGLASISFSFIDNDHAYCNSRKLYRVTVDSQLNNLIASLMGQVVFSLLVQIPGNKVYTFSKVLSRNLPVVGDIISASQDLQKLGLDFEVNLLDMSFGNNPCSNNAALFVAEYNIEFYASYAVGCRLKQAGCSMNLHVNPAAPVKETIQYPVRWNPTEHLISNLTIESSNGVPYPQETILSNKRS